MTTSRFKLIFLLVILLSLGCFLYFGLSVYLFAQENKKEHVISAVQAAESKKPELPTGAETNEYLADYSATLTTPEKKKESETQIQELPAEATAGFSETITPVEETEPKAAPVKKTGRSEPLIVNGDRVEYSADEKEVTASGEVKIDYKGAELTCQKISLNTETKEGEAVGNVKLIDPRGSIMGSKIVYNFQNKTGSATDAEFMSNPYFGKARRFEKVSGNEFIAMDAKTTTCSYDNPHYNLKVKKMDFFQGEKLQGKDVSFFIKDIPLLYLPSFSRSFQDPLMHLQVTPGSRKEWGKFVLNTWRTNLTDTLNAKVFLDYRTKLGLAEGVGLNYNSPDYGKADFKFYFTNENPDSVPAGSPSEFQRYLARWRQKWDIDERTNLISEFYKIKDEKRKFDPNGTFFDPAPDFLKDYFYREYEKDEEPLSYALFHHAFPGSSFDLLTQYRVNHWFDQVTKLPEARYTLPSFKIGTTPIYVESVSSIANFDKKASTAPVTPNQVNVARIDSSNRILLPLKIAFVQFTPYAGSRETLYDKGSNGETLPFRTIFYTGVDLSTKFYKLYNISTKFMGMEINGLRHVITPTVQYMYNHEPTVLPDELKQIDDIDSLEESNAVHFGLSNKLQTKRKGQSVDLLDLFVSSAYEFKPRYEGGMKSRSRLDDIFVKLKLLPFSWMRIESDAIYSADQNNLAEANYDIILDFAEGRSFSLGQRYHKGSANQITSGLNWRLTPKWRFSAYNRYELGDSPDLVRGMAEQQYILTRDLHCWDVSLAYNRKKNEGSTVWMIFSLKAFPGMEFNFDQIYHKPESGSQSNP